MPQDYLHNRIDLTNIPFTERGSRIMVFRRTNALLFRLVERWERAQAQLGHYRQREPIVDNFNFLDSGGVILPFETDTYAHRARLMTSVGSFDWTFLDTETLLVKLPPGHYGFEFRSEGDRGRADRRGGTMRGIRNVAYTTNAHLLRNEITQLDEHHFRVVVDLEAKDGDTLLLNITPRLGFRRSIPDPDVAIEASRKSWDAWFSAAPPVLEQYREQYLYAWWVMRVGLLATRYYFTREALVPSKLHYVGVWQWDQFFHAIAYRHVDTALAEDQLRIFIDHQQPNGMFPDAIHDEGLVTHLEHPIEGDVTKPPLMAWAALKLYEKSGRIDFLQEIYEPLVRWQQWWTDENRNSKGLYIYRHPYSSGLDDSPLWDYGMPVAAPDLNTYLYIQCQSIARIAELIGETEDAARYRAEAQTLAGRMLATLWNAERGLFESLHDGQPIPVLTPFNLLPLWIDAFPADITARLAKELTDPATFWSDYPLPTVALNDPHFDPITMWRGPTWPNINYLFVDALTHVGQLELAAQLRRKTLDMIMTHGDIYEYYNPITAENPPKAAPSFGWSSACFIDLAIQETAAQQK